ncbi:MAG TPA: hypothetical protein VNG53_03695 [Bacteroidia bacterium]|nr:hypothetical protein [Bacteroidia bacterium]
MKYQLQNYQKQITIVSDGGSENKGSVNTWLENLNSPLISKQI